MMSQENKTANAPPENILECPREKDLYYYRQACENIIRPAGIRKWCESCPHFKEANADAA